MFSKIFDWFKKDKPTEKEVDYIKKVMERAEIMHTQVHSAMQMLGPTVIKTKPGETLDLEVLREELEKVRKKQEQAAKILDMLGIPHHGINIDVEGTQLVDILMDETKFKEISSKLRLKAFW